MDTKFLKNRLLDVLEDNGIPESLLVVKFPKNSKSDVLGWYKGNSQFISKPTIYVDVENHAKVLKELDSFNEVSLLRNVTDTLLHEYGHIIEEAIRFDAKRTGDYSLQNKIDTTFDDYEDFSELFAKYINKDVWIGIKEAEVIADVVKEYTEKVFNSEAVEWVRQPRWKRELDVLLDKYDASLNYCKTQEGSFDKCKKTCEAIESRMSENVKINILRCEGFNGSLLEAHPKWKKLDNNQVVHYVLEVDDVIIDLTSKQFNNKDDFPKIVAKEDFIKEWSDVSMYKTRDVSIKQKTKSSP